MSANSELEPRFGVVVAVRLDGDDDARIQTENARRALDAALAAMVAAGVIRSYELSGG